MSRWLQNFPVGRGEFILVSDLARQRGVFTHLMLLELRDKGVDPQLICGVWMVRAADVAALEPSPPRKQHKTLSSRLDEQAAQLEALRQRVSDLQALLGEKQ